MVISQQLIEEVDGFVRDKTLVLGRYEAVPGLLLEAAKDVIVLRIQLNLVLVKVVKELVGSENLSNLYQLVGITITVEEGFFAENHGGEHGSQTPHVQTVVVLLEIHQQLWAFKIT